MAHFTKNHSQLPNSIQDVLVRLVAHIKPKSIILFGSRARGNHRPNSDFDFAIQSPTDKQAWTKFLVDLNEQALTLYPIDLVLYEELGDDYKVNIQKEGKIIYE